jgi:hypothetical protein
MYGRDIPAVEQVSRDGLRHSGLQDKGFRGNGASLIMRFVVVDQYGYKASDRTGEDRKPYSASHKCTSIGISLLPSMGTVKGVA